MITATMTAPTRKARPHSSEKEKIAHPPYATMIRNAIAELKDRRGSTKPAIVNKIVASTGLDAKIAGRFVGKTLLKGLRDGSFQQPEGIAGLKGRFILPGTHVPFKKILNPAVKTALPTMVAKPKKTVAAKTTAKVSTTKKAAKMSSPKKAAKVSTPKKAAKVSIPKKAAKVSTPKKAAKISTPKKAAAKSQKTPTPKKIGKGKKAKKAAVVAQPAAQGTD